MSDKERWWLRIAVVVGLVFTWTTVVWTLSCFPYSRAVHGGVDIRTSYGLLRWFEVTARHKQAGIASLLPLETVGATRIRPVPAVISMAICVALTAFIAVYARRTLRNLTPRWQCQNCGYMVSAGIPRLNVCPARSNVCPECGELPNLQKDAWAFWR